MCIDRDTAPNPGGAESGAFSRTRKSYRPSSNWSSWISGVLGQLLLELHWPRLTREEQATILDLVDGLIRLRIDLGLLRGGQDVG